MDGDGEGEDHRSGRPRAQPQEHHRGDPAGEARRHHRPLRLRQIQPGLRHPLRRGPATLRGVPLRLRPPVPGADGEAGCGPDRGALPGHLHRPAGGLPQPPLHRGDGDGGLRLSPPALRPRRDPPLPPLRPGGPEAEPRADRRGHPLPPRGLPHHDPGPRGAGPQGPSRSRLRRAPPHGFCPRPRGWSHPGSG